MSPRLCATRRERRAALRTGPAPAPADHQANSYGTPADKNRKRLDDLKAGFALKGYALDEMADGTLLAHRWGLSRRLATLDDSAAFLDALGRPAPAVTDEH